MDSVVYPTGHEAGLRTLSTCLCLLATTIISYCFAERAHYIDFSSWNALLSMKATTWLLILLFIDSWAFVFISGLLVNGIGMSLSPATCSLGIFTCIIFYCASKLLTYLFLLEKVYIVWPNKGTRMSSTAYKVGFVAMGGFVVVLVMMFIGRIAYIRDDRQCVIGLHRAASMTTLFVDLGVNILLTSMFLWPLWRSNFVSINIRRVASRTLVASLCALMISVTNLAVLTVLHGRELGWICLSSCTTDVLVNAVVLFWLTRPRHNGEGSHSSRNKGKGDPGKSSMNTPVPLRPISNSAAVAAVVPVVVERQSGSGYGVKSVDESASEAAMKSSGRLDDIDSKDDAERSQYVHWYSDVYDGSQPYYRTDQQLSPSNTRGLQNEYPPISPTTHTYHQNHHQRRHSVGFIQPPPILDKTSFFDRFRVRSPSSPSAPGNEVLSGLKSVGGVGSTSGGRIKKVSKRGRDSSDEGNMEVRVTVTTHLEHEEVYEDLRKEGGPFA